MTGQMMGVAILCQYDEVMLGNMVADGKWSLQTGLDDDEKQGKPKCQSHKLMRPTTRKTCHSPPPTTWRMTLPGL